MTTSPSKEVEDLIELLEADPARTAILTDVDGTLAPITHRPEHAAVPAAARTALSSIQGRFGLVACISGRRATQARELVGVDGITYSGNHGMETLGPDSQELQVELHLRAHLDAAGCFVEELDSARLDQLGLRLEDKGPIQALHWRGAPSEDEAEAEAKAIASAAEGAGLEAHWGRKVLEIRPPGGGGKGAAIFSLLNGTDLELAVYAGDDRTDLDAFRSLREIAADPGPMGRAVCVGIASAEGPEELAAESDLLLAEPQQWIEILGRLGR